MQLTKKKFPILYAFSKPFSTSELIRILNEIDEQTSLVSLEDIIIKNLKPFNFNKSSNSYKYMIDAIFFCISEPSLFDNFEKKLFTRIAAKYSLDNSLPIKWSMEKGLVSMLRYTDANIIKQYFPYTTKPSTKTFVKEMVNIITPKINKIENLNMV